MRIEEAKYVSQKIREVIQKDKGIVLNLGSSSRIFREKAQPHVQSEIFTPLDEARIKVVHVDLKEMEGVDISGDIFDADVQEKLGAIDSDLVMACNMMEHLEEEKRHEFPGILEKLVKSGGFVLISVPNSYPLHLDPIDTYYRPTPEEIAALFPSMDVIDLKIVPSTSYFSDLKKKSLKKKIRIFLRCFAPFYKPTNWLCHVHRMLWLFRPYKSSCVVLQKR